MTNIDKFIKNHPMFTHAADIQEICAPIHEIDLVYFAHAHLDEKNQLSGLGTNPYFLELYLRKGYYKFDVHLGNLPVGEHLIIWDSVVRKKETKNLHEDFMSFDQGHTFTIVYNNGKTKDCYHFATKLGNTSMNDEYMQRIVELKKFISYFKEMVARDNILESSYEKKIGILPVGCGYFTEGNLTEAQWQAFRDNTPVTRIYLDGTDSYLTIREVQCLEAMSLGKTAEEISDILKIAPRTVNAHVTNMKEKLGCQSQFQLGMWFEKLKKIL